jgi:hypothetical protein
MSEPFDGAHPANFPEFYDHGLATIALRPPIDVIELVGADLLAIKAGHNLDAVAMGLPEECQTGVAVYRELLEMVFDNRRRLTECALGREVPHGRGGS